MKCGKRKDKQNRSKSIILARARHLLLVSMAIVATAAAISSWTDQIDSLHTYGMYRCRYRTCSIDTHTNKWMKRTTEAKKKKRRNTKERGRESNNNNSIDEKKTKKIVSGDFSLLRKGRALENIIVVKYRKYTMKIARSTMCVCIFIIIFFIRKCVCIVCVERRQHFECESVAKKINMYM